MITRSHAEKLVVEKSMTFRYVRPIFRLVFYTKLYNISRKGSNTKYFTTISINKQRINIDQRFRHVPNSERVNQLPRRPTHRKPAIDRSGGTRSGSINFQMSKFKKKTAAKRRERPSSRMRSKCWRKVTLCLLRSKTLVSAFFIRRIPRLSSNKNGGIKSTRIDAIR